MGFAAEAGGHWCRAYTGEPTQAFLHGDTDCSGEILLTDAALILGVLFLGEGPLVRLNITDAVDLLRRLFSTTFYERIPSTIAKTSKSNPSESASFFGPPRRCPKFRGLSFGELVFPVWVT